MSEWMTGPTSDLRLPAVPSDNRGIPVEQDPDPEETFLENCCFCRKTTRYWTNLVSRKPGDQVACCPECAKVAEPDDVPTKEVWWRRERIATKG